MRVAGTVQNAAGAATSPGVDALFDALFRNAIDGVLFTRTDGTVLRANPAACRVLGLSEEQVIRAGRTGLVVADEALARLLADRSRSGTASGDVRMRRGDGTTFLAELTSTLIAGPDGEALHSYVIFRDVTERRTAEWRALEHSRQLARVVETAMDGFFMLAAEGRIVDVNPALCTMTGYSREELLRMSVADLEVEESPEETAAHIARLRRFGTDRFATRHRRKDGTVRHVLVSAATNGIGDADFVAFVQDVTDHRTSEEALRRSEAIVRTERDRLAALLASIRDEVWFMEPDGRVVLANPAARSEFRIEGPTDIAIGDLATSVEVFRPDGSPRPAEESPLLQALRSGGIVEIEEVVRTPASKALRHREVSASAVKDAGGAVIGAVAVVRDVTAHRQADSDRVRLAMAIEQAAETVVVTDTTGTITYVNPAFEQVTGYSRSEAIGQNPRILKSGVQPSGIYAELWQTIGRGGTWRGRLVNRRKDGTHFTEEASISPVRDAGGATLGYVAVKRDITVELELESRLRQSQRLESIGRLAGGVAHDFNNLLTVILTAGEDLQDAARGGRAVEMEELDEIVDAGRRASELTRQLLAFARRQPVAPRVIDLNEAVRASDRLFRRVIGENVRVAEHLAPGAWPIHCDPGALDQVLMNLVVNARDAMPDGGVLTLSTDNLSIAPGEHVPDSEMSPGEYVKLTVKDTGTGMSPEVLAHVFEPFFTTKPPGAGTGLGLATVYGIVRQSGAFVDVHSEVGRGTTFEIFFPRASRTGAEGSREPAPSRARGHETVLVVEDDATVRHVAVRALRAAGYTVLEASGGRQALELARGPGTSIDLMLADVVMPGMMGPEVAKQVAKIQPALRVLFMSGYARDSMGRHAALDDGTRLLAKPFTSDALLARVREALDRPVDALPGP